MIKGPLFIMALMAMSVAYATPPTGVNINYDTDKGILYVTAKHPTDRPDHHYINHVRIYKNDVLVDTHNYFWQKSPRGLEENFIVAADPGDKIMVEMTCVEGGKASAETTVLKPVKADEGGQK